MEDIKKLIDYITKSKKFDYKSISNIIISIFSTFYHFLDNIVLLGNLGILGDNIIDGLNWKTGKNFFSLVKSSFKLFTNIVELVENYRQTMKDQEKDNNSERDYKLLNKKNEAFWEIYI